MAPFSSSSEILFPERVYEGADFIFNDQVYINEFTAGTSDGHAFSAEFCPVPGENRIHADISREWEAYWQECREECWTECDENMCWEVCDEICEEHHDSGSVSAWAEICADYGLTGSPDIVITNPRDGETLFKSPVLVRGIVNDPAAETDVNGIPVSPDSEGYFEVSVPLDPGISSITATASSGASQAQHTVTAMLCVSPPSVSVSAAPSAISGWQSSGLSWSSVNAQHVFIDNGIGFVPDSGSEWVRPRHTTVYTVTAVNPHGAVSAQAKIMVMGDPDPLPQGTFGAQYQNLIPPDATVNEYDPKLFSVITGLVSSPDGSPLPDVSVTVHGHPEYGTALTNAQGRFSIPAEGGTTLTVAYHKLGMISSQRKVYVPPTDIAIAETIRMIPDDPAATTVVFDGSPDTVMTHRSTPVTDEFGTRALTMVFTGNNRAYMTDEKGNDITEMKTVTVRASEFTTPESMPAILPPSSGFTYCAELSADGVQRVRFDKPVVTYVDNFPGFDVGEGVPAGYYDRDRGVWVSSGNGVVVRLLDKNRDGIADGLDADGDGRQDDLNGNKSYSDEVAGLTDPQKYPPGATFLRVPITHFTPWDFNWCSFLALMKLLLYGSPDADEQCDGDCKEDTSSFVETRSRVFHEDIPVPGTDMTLHYTSNRTEGNKTKITVPAGGTEVPDMVKKIVVRVEVAGQSLEQTLEPLPDQVAEFAWDGKDFLGNPVRGTVTAHTSVGFVYDSVYMGSGYLAMSFARFGTEVTEVPAREEVINWQHKDLKIHMSGGAGSVAKGWTLSVHHDLSPDDYSVLYKGDGSVSGNNAVIADTVAGNPDANFWQSGWQATRCSVGYPYHVAPNPDGSFYFTSGSYYHIIQYVSPNGYIRKAAGVIGDNNIPEPGYSGDGGLAIFARLRNPAGMAADSSGNLFVADRGNHRIRKIDTDGIITTVAGNGQGYSGDEGPALQALLDSPGDVAADPFGNLYIADTGNHCVRMVNTNGIIITVAGDGTPGYAGDGGQAVNSRLNTPTGVAADAQGNIYIADQGNHRIRKINASGTVTTVAGNGTAGFAGDGGTAEQAWLNSPSDVSADAEGSLFIADRDNHRIRKVDTSGIIITLAGNGTIGYTGNKGPAARAELNSPSGVSADASGNVYVADTHNETVRILTQPSSISGLAADGNIVFTEDDGTCHIMSPAGRHLRTTDLDTGIVLREFGYDADNSLVTITDRFNNQTVIERGAGGVPTAIVSPYGVRTELTVDANSHLKRITNPDTGFYEFEYTSEGLLTVKTDPEKNRFGHGFDTLGRVTDTWDENGGHWQFSRTENDDGKIYHETLTGENNVTSYLDYTDSTGRYTSVITSPSGAETLFSRSSDGMAVSKSLPCGTDLEFKYDVDPEYGFRYVREMRETTPAGLSRITLRDKTYEDTDSDNIPDMITETVTVSNRNTILAHNIPDAKRTATSPEGRNVTTFYDPATLLTSVVSITGFYDTAYGYDEKGRLKSVRTGTRETGFGYDDRGNLDYITDPETHTTSFDYDDVGRLTAIHRPDTTSVFFDYDMNGNMTMLTNPTPADHGFGYNKINLRDSYQTPLSGNYSYLYDKDRRLTKKIFPSAKEISYVYENTKLMHILTPDGDTDFTYYPCGAKIKSVTKGSESVTYDYDGSLVTSETLGGTLNQILSYGYNDDFALQSFTYAGNTVSYSYDNDGLLTGAGNFTISRKPENGLPEAVAGGSLNLTRTFNGYGETDAQDYVINGQTVASWTLSRDNNGRIRTKTETADGVTSEYVYDYDPLGRLLTVTKDGVLTEEYRYDANGTRNYEMNMHRGISGRTLTYSDEDHLMTAGATSYQYDPDGFLVSRTDGSGTTTYDYSVRGELLGVSLPDGRNIEYRYDPLGRRIAKIVDGTVAEKYLWQGMTRLLAVYDGSDSLIMSFEYAEGRMPVAVNKESSVYYLTCDQVGSLRIVADASGNVVKRVDYDSFGNIISDTDSAFEIFFGFAGGLHDRDTGLVRFGYRDYDPEAGRWTAKDPILFEGGDTNLYGYCMNDPVKWIDPFGLQSYTYTSIDMAINDCLKRPTLKQRIECLEDLLDWLVDSAKTRKRIRNIIEKIKKDAKKCKNQKAPKPKKEHTKGKRKSTHDKHTKKHSSRK